jgi:hypothetical protein
MLSKNGLPPSDDGLSVEDLCQMKRLALAKKPASSTTTVKVAEKVKNVGKKTTTGKASDANKDMKVVKKKVMKVGTKTTTGTKEVMKVDKQTTTGKASVAKKVMKVDKKARTASVAKKVMKVGTKTTTGKASAAKKVMKVVKKTTTGEANVAKKVVKVDKRAATAAAVTAGMGDEPVLDLMMIQPLASMMSEYVNATRDSSD